MAELTPQQRRLQLIAKARARAKKQQPDKPGFEVAGRQVTSPTTALAAYLLSGGQQRTESAAKGGIGEGLVNLAGGAGQRVAGIGEKMGLLPEGYEQRVTGGAEALKEGIQQRYPQQGPLRTGARLATEVAPFMAYNPIQGAGIATGAAKSGLAGLLGGFSAYQPDPEGEGTLGKAAQTGGFGAAVGTALPLAGGLAGRAWEAFAPTAKQASRRALQGVSMPEAMRTSRWARGGPTVAVRQGPLRGSWTGQRAVRTGDEVFVAPGARDAPETMADIGRIRFSDPADRTRIKKLLKRSESGVNRRVGSLYSDILPEGSPTQVQQQVDDLFRASGGEQVPEEVYLRLAENPTIGDAIDAITRSEQARRRWIQNPERSVGRLNEVRKVINDRIADAAKAAEKGQPIPRLELDDLYAAKEELLTSLRRVSPQIDEALSLSHREHIIRDMADQFGYGRKYTDRITEVPPLEIHNKFFKDRKKFNELLDNIRAIKDPELRKRATQKAVAVRGVLDRYAKTKEQVDKIITGSDELFEQRSWLGQAIFYTAKNKLQAKSNRAVLDYILDRQADPALAQKALAAQDPADFAMQFMKFLALAGARDAPEVSQSLEQANAEEGR